MSEITGRTLAGRYRVESLIGRGGMAEVFKVWDIDRSVTLAMKLLREDLAQDTVFLRRFRREAHTLARLQHPNIVRFYGLAQDDLFAFMLMEYVEGTSLRTEIFRHAGQPMSSEAILGYLRPICAALNYAHRQGMVHCDVKPANILIDKTGHVFVSDFGIARLTETATTTTTMVGAGTPAYMSPEQARGDNPAPQTDIYALGIMLFEVLTGGERPFTGDLAQTTGSTSEKVRWEQMNLRPPSPRKWNPQIAPEVEAVVLRCLDKERARRYASTPEMLAALEQALSQQPRYIPVPVPPEPPHPTPANSRRSRRKQATAAAFVFIGLITIGYVLLGSPTGQGPLLWSATPVLTSMPTPTYTDTPTLPPEAVATLDLSAANQGTAMTPAAPAATGGNVHHIVKPGETLFSIGHQHNVNPYVIAAANNIPYPYIIYLGQQLVIPTDSTPTEMTPTYTSTAISTATPSRTQTYTTTATDTPSSTPTKTRLRPTLPIRTNTPTPIPIPIDTPTPVPAFTVIFTAKSNTISPGQCATVHWEVYGVQAILYQDQWEVWAGDRIECPGSTTTYKLTVQLYSGEYRDYFVTVSVQ